MDSCCVSLALHLDRWLDGASHRDCSIIFMYRVLEIEINRNRPQVLSLDALRRTSNAYFERSPGNAEWARERLRNRFRVVIRELDTVNTVRGGSAKSRKCTVAKCLHEARARGSRVLFVLVVSIARLRLGGFYSEMSQTRKKRSTQ